MPELPEVETTRRGIAPLVCGRTVVDVVVRQPRLRWPVPEGLNAALIGERIEAVRRRAKYLLLDTAAGSVMVHLGMSGSLRLVAADRPVQIHDHVDLGFDNGRILRLTDPRRFGAVLWVPGAADDHPLLRHLGPEPLGDAFDGALLYRISRGRRIAVKSLLMDARVVVGVGNIYASEALFAAGIDPRRAAGRVSLQRYQRLSGAVRKVLAAAIAAGGTTLRDFVDEAGRPGYFAQRLAVYGREGRPCLRCATAIRRTVIGQRSTFHCPGCQR